MKRFSLIAVSFIFAALMAVSVQAQTPTTSDKIGLVAWGAFQDPTNGIKKYTAALAALDKEFEPLNQELKTLATSYETLKTELEGFQKLVNEKKPVPIPPLEIQKKVDNLGQIERDIKKKQEDAKARFESRYKFVVEPVEEDILKALTEYAQQKSFAVILDGAKLFQSGVLLAYIEKVDITKDFITFYNARPTPK